MEPQGVFVLSEPNCWAPTMCSGMYNMPPLCNALIHREQYAPYQYARIYNMPAAQGLYNGLIF